MTTSTNGKFDRKPFIAGNWKMNMDHVQGITLLQKLAWTLSDMFGGGMSSGLSSSGVAERNLNRFTVILGITWGVVIIALGLLMRFSTGADS